jgi:hypothetical protein
VIKGYLSTATQIGADINGEAAGDNSGSSVSFNEDATVIAIGARQNDGNGSNSGHVRIYNYNGTAWTQLGGDIDGETSSDYSGNSVSLSSDGKTIAIGASVNDGPGSNSGHVRIYNYNGTAWTQLGGDIDGEAAGDQSGQSVSLSSDGKIVAVGAKTNDGNGTNSGHVRIYNYNGTAWTQLGTDIDGEAVSDQSGYSVSLSSDGKTVAIGAVANGTSSGHVRIYNYNDTDWAQLGADIDGEAASDYSGYSISLSSDGASVAIGAIGNDGNGTDSGHVRVYNLVLENKKPIAVADKKTVKEDSSLTSIDVIINDTDEDGDDLSLVAVNSSGTGTLALNSDGLSVDYTPAINFNGTEVVIYTVSDGFSNVEGTLTITGL